MFECSSLSFSYDKKPRLKDISLRMESGMLVGLFGHNGCGKSTLLKMLSGVLPVLSGDVKFMAQSIIAPDHHVKRSIRRYLGVLFQGTSSDEKLSPYFNLVYGAHLMGIEKSRMHKVICETLARANLTERATDAVKKLSGGMRRRLELYRTFMHEPRLVLLDEPTAGLDFGESGKFFTYLKNYRKSHGAAVLMSTHRAEELMHCDYVILMKDGAIIAEGIPADMLKNLDYVRISFSLAEGITEDGLFNVMLFDRLLDEKAGVIRGKIHHSNLYALLHSTFLSDGSIKSFAIDQPSLADCYEDLCHGGVAQ